VSTRGHVAPARQPDRAAPTLHERTEGWIAGLPLAGLALQRQPAHEDAFVLNFTGSHRHILDYLMQEVQAGQPEDMQTFLL
jgi:LuxR family transcriptional regulator, maltose regulon positive regulatory protein